MSLTTVHCLTRVDSRGVPCIVQRYWFTTKNDKNILNIVFFDKKETELVVEPEIVNFSHHTIEAIAEIAWYSRHFGRKYVIRT